MTHYKLTFMTPLPSTAADPAAPPDASRWPVDAVAADAGPGAAGRRRPRAWGRT